MVRVSPFFFTSAQKIRWPSFIEKIKELFLLPLFSQGQDNTFSGHYCQPRSRHQGTSVQTADSIPFFSIALLYPAVFIDTPL
jgi:hypothetical protein